MPNSAYAHHDRITLSGITAVGFHGVLDFEKRDGQPFTVDATLYTDFADAAAGMTWKRPRTTRRWPN